MPVLSLKSVFSSSLRALAYLYLITLPSSSLQKLPSVFFVSPQLVFKSLVGSSTKNLRSPLFKNLPNSSQKTRSSSSIKTLPSVLSSLPSLCLKAFPQLVFRYSSLLSSSFKVMKFVLSRSLRAILNSSLKAPSRFFQLISKVSAQIVSNASYLSKLHLLFLRLLHLLLVFNKYSALILIKLAFRSYNEKLLDQ